MGHFNFKNLFTNSSSLLKKPKERRAHKRPEGGYDITILVVDDSRTVVVAFTKALTQAGFRVISATNGKDGVAMAKAQQPDLVLMDIVMPGLNGFQATRKIRKAETTSHIPIIIVSGEQQAMEQFWGKRVGASGFLSKPINRGHFFGKIFEVLESHTSVNTG
ncbi:MAG: response regulator [Gammaproteobacteria bacterium]|nr:response regulator [Gammaproteobacteria bacterium]